jgi:hypothetical protein
MLAMSSGAAGVGGRDSMHKNARLIFRRDCSAKIPKFHAKRTNPRKIGRAYLTGA